MDKVRKAAADLAAARAAAKDASDALHLAVHQAREEGATWSELGRALGVTRQTAQQRFGRTVVVTAPPPKPAQPRRKKPRSKR